MNAHEQAAWRTLVALGARATELGGKDALDLTPVRIRSARALGRFVSALTELPGRSGAVRRHVNYRGEPVYLVAGPLDAPHG